jgi:O-antigen ligase
MMMEASYDRAKLIFIFLFGIFLQAVLGIYQFLFQTSFAFKWLGLASHNPAELGTSVIEAADAGRWLRAYGGFDHPNILGGVLAIAILLTLALILKSRETKTSWRSHATWYYFFLPIFSLTLFFTFSRSAWLGVIVGIMIMLAVAVRQKDWLAQKKILEIILVLGIFVFILSNIFSGLVNARLDADTRLEIKSNTERIKSYQAAWSLIKNHWLLGVGVGNYTLAEFNLDPTQPSYYYQPTHNTFFLIISEIGLLGFLFFILIILLLFQGGARGGLSKNKNFFSFVILVAILVMSMFDHWWWSLHFGILFFGMMMGLTRIKWHAGLALD